MKFRLASFCCALLTLADPALADETPAFPQRVVDDAKHVLTEPSRWDQTQWQEFGYASLAVLGTGLLLDRPLQDAMKHDGDNTLLTQVERFGAQYSIGVIGGFYLAGTLDNDAKALSVAEDSFTASLIASGIVTPTLKFAVGRSRPRDSNGIAHFTPFSYGNSSFPSGHTTEAFTLASVIARHYNEEWVDYTAYTTASLVGIARIYHEAHFASDVLAGALIGTWVGQSVVDHNRQLRSGGIVLIPEMAPGRVGLRLAAKL